MSHGEMMRQATLSILDAATSDEEAHRPWLTALLARRPTKVAAIALANKMRAFDRD